MTTAFGALPVWMKVLSSLRAKAESSMGVLDWPSDLIRNVSVVPIFRLNWLATLWGSFSMKAFACWPTRDPVISEANHRRQHFRALVSWVFEHFPRSPW